MLKLAEEERPKIELNSTYSFMMSIPHHQGEQGVGYYPFSHLACNLPKTSFRFLANAAIRATNIFREETTSSLAGLEFPLTEKLSFTGEWFSGTHYLSAFIPGLTWHTEDIIFVGGHKTPNDFKSNEYGLEFDLGVFWAGR